MSEIFNAAKQQSAADDRGFRPHPCGQFHAVITEIRAGSYEGREFWEIKIKSDNGMAKQTIWRASESDIERHYMPRFGGDRAQAVAALQKAWARQITLYKDLGLGEPANEVALYENLGQMIGRKCWLVVKENPNDQTNPFVFINAPRNYAPNAAQQQQPQQQPQQQQQKKNPTQQYMPTVSALGNPDDVPF